jgi:hypothetical protein
MMRRAGLVLPALVLLTGCAGLDPAAAYRAAARNLRFRLEAVHPRLDVVFPLDRSALVLAVDLAVDNPSKLRLAARALGGAIHLEAAEGNFPLGQLRFPAGVNLEPTAKQTVRAELRLPYGEIRRAWKALEAVALRDASGTWKLEGSATLELLGVPLELPVRTSLRTGTPPR